MNEYTEPAVIWSIMKVNKVLYIMILRVIGALEEQQTPTKIFSSGILE